MEQNQTQGRSSTAQEVLGAQGMHQPYPGSVRHWRGFSCSFSQCEETGGSLTCLDTPFSAPFPAVVMSGCVCAQPCSFLPGQTLLCSVLGWAEGVPWAWLWECTWTQRRHREGEGFHPLLSAPEPGHGAGAASMQGGTFPCHPQCHRHTRLSLSPPEWVILSQMCLSKNISLLCFLTICPGP